MTSILMLLTLLQAPAAALENEYVRVTRDAVTCGEGGDGCRDRILVVLDSLDVGHGLRGSEVGRRKLSRGEIAVFGADDRYSVSAGRFLEVVIKPGHPRATPPGALIAPDKNAILHDGRDFFVFEEKLDPGDTRARHSHSQRVVIVLNKTRLQQWPDGQPELFRDQIPDDVRFNPPVIHVVKTVGDKPLRNIVIEFKP